MAQQFRSHPRRLTLLLALVERCGRLVEKEELFKVVWPDTIVEESNLSSNIALIRKALGDGESGLKFIETVPKRGYRFVAQVREVKRARDPVGEERIVRERLEEDQARRYQSTLKREGHSRAPSVGRPQDEEFKPQNSTHKARPFHRW
jgi:DNA-binding winged helix-turn-helix (wHTH) protein